MSLRITGAILGFLAAAAAFGSGDGTNNGGGIAEQNFSYAWARMPALLEACSLDGGCGLGGDRARLLARLIQAFPREMAQGGLVFESEKTHPERLCRDEKGEFRLTCTGTLVGSPITVDQELLYPAGDDGRPDPLSIADGVAALVLALSSHQTDFGVDAARGLAVDVAALYSSLSQELRLSSYGRPEVRVISFARSTIVTGDDQTLEDVGGLVGRQLECPESGAAPRGITVANLHWLPLPAYDAAAALQPVAFIGRLGFFCQAIRYEGAVRFIARFKASPGWRADHASPFSYIENGTTVSFEDIHATAH